MDKLEATHGACADVSDFTAFDKVMQSFHGLFRGCVVVVAVDLEEIDVMSVEAFERGIDGVEDSSAGETTLVDVFGLIYQFFTKKPGVKARVVSDETVAFGGYDDAFTRDRILHNQSE